MSKDLGMITSSHPLETERRHPTLYFDDGNVALSGVSRNYVRLYFRIHRSILCAHSPVMANMFAIPPLHDEESETKYVETYDGVLHIEMPDSAEDLESFLSVLYDPSYATVPLNVRVHRLISRRS
ncbi:hypothetical protein NM688_g9391 [Phlebia brevispora]|uniref:Uncharacterized protein n=1 Tax=Phlebia brevispora TaxID=194682 RepID=A0ACC1RIW6_9APHY|nr:hypothetical protein NM688_g9391 [Phlebia brevispora]